MSVLLKMLIATLLFGFHSVEPIRSPPYQSISNVNNDPQSEFEAAYDELLEKLSDKIPEAIELIEQMGDIKMDAMDIIKCLVSRNPSCISIDAKYTTKLEKVFEELELEENKKVFKKLYLKLGNALVRSKVPVDFVEMVKESESMLKSNPNVFVSKLNYCPVPVKSSRAVGVHKRGLDGAIIGCGVGMACVVGGFFLGALVTGPILIHMAAIAIGTKHILLLVFGIILTVVGGAGTLIGGCFGCCMLTGACCFD